MKLKIVLINGVMECVCVILIFSLFLFNYLCTYVTFQLFPHGEIRSELKKGRKIRK